MKLKYCKKCLMPSTKPYITFNSEGVCNACISSEEKSKCAGEGQIDWGKRESEFEDLIDWVKEQQAPYYDAMVPVSGGKDSITQVHRLLNRGLRILAVNVDYGIKTEIGKYNLELIPEMGANLIILRPELKLHKKLIKIGLEDYGDPDLLSHTLLHAYPLHIAKQFKIPLCLLGENAAFEYGGKKSLAEKNEITREYFDNYAANKGMTANVISEKYLIPFDKLWQYDFPDDIQNDKNIKAVFCSYYYSWDSNENLKIAQKYGFKQLDDAKEGTYRKFVGVDEQINRLHQFIKVLKFGYGRASDHACEDIRLGILSRSEAKKLIKHYDLQPLGNEYINDLCDFLEYGEEQFLQILDSFRDKDIWNKNNDGEWYIEGHLED
jgi:N-acetyl sugar amidotransferase